MTNLAKRLLNFSRLYFKSSIVFYFYQIYIKASIEVCEQRDVKGLYKRARSGEIQNFTGIHQPFEEPENPDLVINTGELSIEESVKLLMKFTLEKIKP